MEWGRLAFHLLGPQVVVIASKSCKLCGGLQKCVRLGEKKNYGSEIPEKTLELNLINIKCLRKIILLNFIVKFSIYKI